MKKIKISIAALFVLLVAFNVSVSYKNAQSDLMFDNIQALSQSECYTALPRCSTSCYYEWCGYCYIGGVYFYLQECIDK